MKNQTKYILIILLFSFLSQFNVYSTEQAEGEVMSKIIKLNIAVSDGEKMARFYRETFGIEWQKFEYSGYNFYSAKLGEMELMLAPKEIAGVDVAVNNIQLTFEVQNIEQTLTSACDNKGKIKDEIQVQDEIKVAGLLDPEGNTIEVIER